MWKHLICLNLAAFCAMAAEPIRKTLVSVSSGVRVEAWDLNARDAGLPASVSVRKSTLHGGKQEGVDLITVNNGRLSFSVIASRGMGIARVDMGGIRLGWDSPVKEIVHPQHIDLASRGGLGWLEGFNEWMVRCGLEFAGHPGKDKFITNTGDESEMDLTLHGKIGNIPASEVEVVVDGETIRVRGRVDERMFYGPKLEMWTEISTKVNSNAFAIEDQIKNHGAFDQEFQMIYHANYGPPLLEAGARLAAPVKQVTPFNAHAARDVRAFDTYAGPTKGFVEQVFCLRLLGDASGGTMIMLKNAAGSRAVTMAYSLSQLPYLTLWKNTSALEEGYVTGLEPGTGFPFNRRVERHFGRVPKLKPGETRTLRIEYAIHDSASAVAAAQDEIKRLQGGIAPILDPAPAPLPQ